jgi:hypothetical protein
VKNQLILKGGINICNNGRTLAIFSASFVNLLYIKEQTAELDTSAGHNRRMELKELHSLLLATYRHYHPVGEGEVAQMSGAE